MLHVVYAGDVHPDEAVSSPDLKPVEVFRVKTPSGRYYHVFADSREAAETWAATQTNDPKAAAKAAATASKDAGGGGFLGLGRRRGGAKPAEEGDTK